MNPRNRTFAIVGGVVLVILVVLGIALLASGDGDDDETESTVPAGESADGTGAESDAGNSESGTSGGGETRPVTVRGAPLPPFESPDGDPAVGMTAPVLDGESFDGSALTIGDPDENDGPTMVVFLAHWCPHCNAEIPELIELDERGDLPDDLAVVGVSTAANPDGDNYPPSEWIAETGWPWPIMVDSPEFAALNAYGGTGFPFTVMLDENGVVLARKAGSGSADEIQAWIDAAIG
jgi:thiol-disulfide isomerase/thioredoxin